ncbi:hypothetical protein JKP88DRAFT_256040 [Tribonema minus]|uniref:Uncharacterized protein n=1 Tax=Tribonema minus TaxID=303371 RepID=A0A835YUY8_9STRA|nr:hypothetical protein JKP88DRAFT_256040 [Tribonema minus]
MHACGCSCNDDVEHDSLHRSCASRWTRSTAWRTSSRLILAECGALSQPIPALRADFVKLPAGAATTVGKILFNKLEALSSAAATTAATGAVCVVRQAPVRGGPSSCGRAAQVEPQPGDSVKKKEAWQALASSLPVRVPVDRDAEGRACLGDVPIRTAAQLACAPSTRTSHQIPDVAARIMNLVATISMVLALAPPTAALGSNKCPGDNGMDCNTSTTSTY